MGRVSAYAPIWRALKNDGTSVVLDVVPARLRQLRKALWDMKYLDREFQESLLLSNQTAKLLFDVNKAKTRVIVYLVYTEGIKK